MKKLLAVLLAVMMTLSIAPAMAEESKDPRPDWTEYDQLIDDIKSTTDFVEREAMMHRAEDILRTPALSCRFTTITICT